MKISWKICFVPALTLLLCTAAAGPAWSLPGENRDQAVEILINVLEKQDRELEAYRRELQEAGERLYREEGGQLRRAYQQRLGNAQRKLGEEGAGQAEKAFAELREAILKRRLELLLLPLEGQEGRTKLEELCELEGELAERARNAEEELQRQGEELRRQYERALNDELLQLQRELEEQMEQEFARREQEFVFLLGQEMSALTRRPFSNRSY